MKLSSVLCASCAALLLQACDDSTGSSSSSRIDPAIAGTWARIGGTRFSDTLIFLDARYQTPYGSGTGTHFSASGGVAKCGYPLEVCGEYKRSNDTLYFEALLGQAPDGVVPSITNAYLWVP